LGIPIVGSDLYLSADNEQFRIVREIYGHTHRIEAVIGTKVNFTQLTDNQSVCWGDGANYHFRLTALEVPAEIEV
jgi:hypothetical protein